MGAGWAYGPQVLCDEEGILLCRACREGADGKRDVVLAVLPAAEHPTPQSLDRLAHEYELKDELDGAWAAKPLELVQDRTRTILVLEDLGGEPLTWLVGAYYYGKIVEAAAAGADIWIGTRAQIADHVLAQEAA